MTEIAGAFAPSGLLRVRIEGGRPAQVFAAADMRHRVILAEAGLAAPVALFARNRFCALAQSGSRETEIRVCEN